MQCNSTSIGISAKSNSNPCLLLPPQVASMGRAYVPGQSEGRAGCDGKARPTIPAIREALAHELVYVVVVAVLDARVDASGPRGPEAVADPALAEGGHARRGRPVRGISGVEGVSEVEVLNLDCVAASGYP